MGHGASLPIYERNAYTYNVRKRTKDSHNHKSINQFNVCTRDRLSFCVCACAYAPRLRPFIRIVFEISALYVSFRYD